MGTIHFIEEIKSVVQAFILLYKGRPQLCDLLGFLYGKVMGISTISLVSNFA